jgi:hypothetical protein
MRTATTSGFCAIRALLMLCHFRFLKLFLEKNTDCRVTPSWGWLGPRKGKPTVVEQNLSWRLYRDDESDAARVRGLGRDFASV